MNMRDSIKEELKGCYLIVEVAGGNAIPCIPGAISNWMAKGIEGNSKVSIPFITGAISNRSF